MKYLDIVDLMDEPKGYETELACIWINPHKLPRRLSTLGNFDYGFYKMPCWHINNYYIKDQLTPIKVPIVSFSEDLFCNNLEITDLILSTNLSSLDEASFSGMKNLKRIWLPKKITYIPKDCFKDCNSLRMIYYEGTYEEFSKIDVFCKQYRVIPKLGITDDVEVYYDLGNLPFIKASVYCNQKREQNIKNTVILERLEKKNGFRIN